MRYKLYIIFSLLLTVCLLLAACAGTGSDAGENHGAPVSDTPDGDVIATVNGEAIPYGDFAQQMATIELMAGSLSGTVPEETIQSMLDSEARGILDKLIRDVILRQKAEEYGLTLTAEEERQAQAAWEETREKLAASVERSYPDASEEDLDALIQIAIESSGMQEETVVKSARQSLLTKKLQAAAVLSEAYAVSDGDINERYQKLLEEQQLQFETDTTAFEAAMLSKTAVVYIPRPYRVLQELELRFDDDIRSLLAQLKEYDTEDDDTYETMLASERELLAEKADEIRERTAGGESFETLMEEYGGRTNYISEATTRFSQSYFDAAFSIEAAGGIAEALIETDSGCTMLRWSDTLSPRVVPLEEAEGELRAQMESERSFTAWTDIQDQWRQQAEVVINEELLSYH